MTKNYDVIIAEAIKHKKNVGQFWSNENEAQGAFRANGCVIGQTWDSSSLALSKEGLPFGYVAPKEGALMWFDQMAIPVDAPNPDAAHTFLNFIMDPENMATASNYVYYANGNKASQEFLNEDVIGDPAIYPTPEAMDNTFTTTPYEPKVQRVVTRLWTKIKSGT